MPDTLLILHVKGTEAQTTELPKHAVREAISQGQITHSQLIWSPLEYAWKQVRELPELLQAPEERFILHVKGTEAGTREMPKQAVRAAVSHGEITHSQLIWSAPDHTWKQLRELPELLPEPAPEERVILHVKGTEAETRELPKQAVRTAVSQGEITHSQLIWSAPDHTWKQVRELPEFLPEPPPEERLILHVKGTEAETKELPKQAVRTALSHGEITHSQLIWSAPDHTWKQVRDLPELLPSQKLAPAPARDTAHAAPVAQVPTIASAPPKVRVASTVEAPPKVHAALTAAGAPQVRVATASASTPQVQVAAVSAKTPQAQVAAATPVVASPKGNLKVKEEEEGGHLIKWICIGLGSLILLVLGGNYFLVTQPLSSNLGQTRYSNVTVYGQFGAFVQPTVLVIHIPPSAALNSDNMANFIVALAQSTPQDPLTGDIFSRVALTPGWTAQYSFPGVGWRELGKTSNEDKDQLKVDIMAQLCDASGEPIMKPNPSLDAAALQAQYDKVWQDFVNSFTAKP